MRGSVAKLLRMRAEDQTVGKLDRVYRVKKRRHSETVSLNPGCTRAVYKKLKKKWNATAPKDRR